MKTFKGEAAAVRKILEDMRYHQGMNKLAWLNLHKGNQAVRKLGRALAAPDPQLVKRIRSKK